MKTEMIQVVSKQGRLCAFCGREGTMTREHLVPAWLFQRAPEPLVADVRTAVGEIAIRGQPTVRDVCRNCNNGPLAALDEYALQLFERYFHRIVEAGDLITLEYDFHMLSRWLVKVAYNNARARSWDFEPSRDLLDFVLAGNTIDSGPEVVLQLVIPTKELPGVHEKVVPIDCRVGLLMRQTLPGLDAGFLVSVRSYHFYLLIPTHGIPRRIREKAFEKTRKSIPGGVRLAGKKRVKIYASFIDFLSDAFRSTGFVRNIHLRPKGE